MGNAKLGRYEVIRTLARGSLTDLLLGRATGEAGFQRHVAIKQLREEHAQDAACLEMFVNEARLAATLHHHNIVQVLDIGEEDGKPFFAMEYVHGVDLRMLLGHLGKRSEQLPLQHVVSIIASAAAALHHAHEQRGPDGAPLGIVHRQVTPANIVVGFDGNVKIVDFGIAKAAIKRIQTGIGVLKGSAPYMAPEQCAGRTIDRRSDVFALGIVLYELSTVRRLFKGENEFLTMSAVVNAEVPRPSQYRRDVPPDLEVLMLKALARDPLARYQTAADMANALDKVARSVGVGASTTALASYLKLQFGERKEPWLEGKVEVDPESTAVDFDGAASGLAPPPNEALKSNAIPKIVAATKSSPIAQARTSVMTPNRAKRASQVPLDKSFAVATTLDASPVDDVEQLEPASSRQSTEGEPAFDMMATRPEKQHAKGSGAPLPKPAPVTVALKLPVAVPASPTPVPQNHLSPTIALVVAPTDGTAKLPPPPVSPGLAPATAGQLRTALAVSPPPSVIETTRPSNRDVQITDATAIVEPLAVVVARAQTTSARRSRTLYVFGGVAAVGAIILAIVLWPSSDLGPATSAGVAATTDTEAPDPDKPEPSPDEPARSAMDMTARDYEAARSDAAAAEETAETTADAAAEAVGDVVAADAAVAADTDVVVEVEPPVEDARVTEVVAETKPAAKPVAAKTPKRTVKKTTPKRTVKKKTTTKKKPKWNPDDLFLGE